ncbi:MAG: phosphate/phosphite/phosphonate ABC transporter substrate-binding protein [Micropepsaceae bacterium]
MTGPLITRRAFGSFAAGGAALALAGCAEGRFDANGYPKWLVSGFSVLETNPARIGALTDYETFIGKEIGIPLRSFRAAGYSGVSLAMMNNQIDFGIMGPANYATIKKEMGDGVDAPLTMAESDGKTSYVAVIFVKASSDIHSLDDLKGRTMAFADVNSASGYLVPRYYLRKEGKDPETFFRRYIFAGGHEQSVSSVLNGTTDAGVTWVSGVGDEKKGFTRGILQRMVQAGTLNMDDLRIVWTSGPIPNGPFVMRQGLPADLRQKIIDAHIRLRQADKAAFEALTGGQGQGFVPAPPGFYDVIFEIKAEEEAARRVRA